MASPFVVPKVALDCSSGFHGCNCCECQNHSESECRYTYSGWCPVCDTKSRRRRSRSEGIETDPLKERNRSLENSLYLRRRMVKEYDGHSYPRQYCRLGSSMNHQCERNLSPVKDVDSDSEMKERSSKFLKNCVKSKFSDTVLNLERSSCRKVDSFVANNCSSLLLNDRSHLKNGLYQNSVNKCDTSNMYSNKQTETNVSTTIKCAMDEIAMMNGRNGDAERSCNSPELYFQEVEALRSKLRALRDGNDGKRIRQRSESEPGVIGMCSSWEAKRSREDHPKATLSNYNSINVRPGTSSALAKNKITRLAQLKRSMKTGFIEDDADASSISSESDIAESEPTCGSEDVESKGGLGDSEEDNHSVISGLTSISTDSNTPSAVGESLGSISINDHVYDEPPVREKFPAYLRPSLFSHVPPFVNFATHETKGDVFPPDIQKFMKWKLSTITPLVVRRTLINTNFKLVRKSNEWCGTWGKHMKSLCFKTLKDFQKINHFPGTFQIGRKDRLWKNLLRLMTKFGKKEFGFIPRTYILPQDTKLLHQVWEKNCGKERWIIKPPASARGSGIKVIHRWTQIPKKRPLVVQKYIADPYLINGSKFDLRLYVLVTSINPLRMYIYDDGLVRFASVKYSSDMASLCDRYMHLTNYSINKLSSQYSANEDASACQGHKWTLKSLWNYLEKDGIDVKVLWNNLVDLCIKTVISGESSISQLAKSNLTSRYCSYEIFGIDVLFDKDLKPWLLEVNISPSLHSSSPLDLAVKGPMVKDLLNLAGFQIPNKLTLIQQQDHLQALGFNQARTSQLCFDKRLYTMVLSAEEKQKHVQHENTNRPEYLQDILTVLSPDDIRHLIQYEDELTQTGRFIRIFPTPDTYTYLDFFEAPRYYNMLFDAWETKYHSRRADGIKLLESYCRRKQHLIVPAHLSGPKSSVSLQSTQSESQQDVELEDTEDSILQNKKSDGLSSLALYRAARPRSGKLGVIMKPYPRSVYITRRKSSMSPVKPVENDKIDGGDNVASEEHDVVASCAS